MRRVRIGRVGRARGKDGAIHVVEPTERLALLDSGRRVYVADRPFKIEWRRGTATRPILKLEGVDDFTSAEPLRDAPLSVPRSELGPLEEGEYLIDDLVGCEVSGERGPIGQVRDVLLLPSVAVLEVELDEGDPLLVPLVEDALVTIDLDADRIAIEERFLARDERELNAPPAGR